MTKTRVTPAAIVATNMKDFAAASLYDGIEAQEKAGQDSFVAEQSLPINCPRNELEELGFVFGADIDELFISVQFPKGWTKRVTEHSMHSDLLDEHGRERGGIFYKAAFYDRKADMHLHRRYRTSYNYKVKGVVQYHVLDGEKVIYETTPIVAEIGDEGYWEIDDAGLKEASDWLNSKFPNHADPLMYWR